MPTYPPAILDDYLKIADDGTVKLLAARCGKEGPVMFPRRLASAAADAADMAPVERGGGAGVWSGPVPRMGPPVVVVQVEYPEGTVVQGYYEGDPEDPPDIGDLVDTVPFVVTVPRSGEQATTYGFRAV